MKKVQLNKRTRALELSVEAYSCGIVHCNMNPGGVAQHIFYMERMRMMGR